MSVDFNKLRLKYHGDAEKLEEILQMECRHKCAGKLSVTLQCEKFIFPSLALAEMSTSDDVAVIHAGMVGTGLSVLDMTAGLGIDTFHFAGNGCHVTAVELSPDAIRCLRSNASSLGLDDRVEIIEGDSVAWLADNNRHFDVIFIDPARRDDSGRHFSLGKCVPDVTSSLPLLMSRCDRLIIKASPMMDISAAVKDFGIAGCDVTVIGTTRECKEVVLTLTEEIIKNNAIRVRCITVGQGEYIGKNDYNHEYGIPGKGKYLLQPYPAVMKGTGGRVGGYAKLHPATHLYVSDELCPEFPGWNYPITDVIPFNKSGIKSVREKYPKINVATRNFPLTAPELVKKLKVIEGGDNMLFGAILNDGSKAMIITGREIRQ